MQYTSREVYEYISKQTNDPIVERKTCAISGTEFPIYQSDLDFYNKISPTFGGIKYQIPTPTLCPEERQRRRLSFRNERKLYKRKCDATGKDIISIYSPNKPYKVYNQNFWWSDMRDPMDYGFDFDFGRSFTDQFGELMIRVPRNNLQIIEGENSNYTNHSYYNKNCYYIFGAIYNSNCLLSDQLASCIDCIDCRIMEKCTNCYMCLSCTNCSNLYYSISSENCSNSYGLYNCNNCEYCINCSNISNKKYYIDNIESTKEEFENYIYKFKYIQSNIELNIKQINTEGSIGNELYNSKNCIFCFDMYECNNCKYLSSELKGIDAMDCYGSSETPLSLECLSVVNGYSNIGNFMCTGNKYIYYNHLCYDSSSLFGCIGLRNKSHCIFNKQYTESEYNELVPKIIAHIQSTGEWGEFFHPSLSPFGYNETVANEYFPCVGGDEEKRRSDESANSQNYISFDLQDFFTPLTKHGYKWSDYSSDPKIPEGVKTYCKKDYSDEDWNDLVNDDNIVKYIIVCEVSGRPFMIQKMELEFYRKHNLPIPSRHPDIRHEDRMRLRPGRTLYLRKCDCCGSDMLSVYDKDYEGKVYCEKCYQKEVYG